MDNTTRTKAHIKVDKIKAFIGYAKEILDTNLINKFYEGINNNIILSCT